MFEFAISFKEINKIILGIDSPNHLLEIIKNLDNNYHIEYPIFLQKMNF